MKASFTTLCHEFFCRARYQAALIPVIPNDRVLALMAADGYKRAATNFTAEQISRHAAAQASACGHAFPYIPRTTVVDHAGRDVVYGDDPALHEQYRQSLKRAAARVYGITT